MRCPGTARRSPHDTKVRLHGWECGGAQRECIVWQSGLIGRQITGEVQHTLKGIAFELHLGKHDAQDERCHPDRYSSTCSRGYTRLRRRICSRHTTAWQFHAFQMPHTGQKFGKPTVLIIRSAHLRACMPPQPSCLPFPLPLGSPRQPSQKQRSNASLIGPSGIRPSKNARVLWGEKRFTDKRQAPRDGCRVRRGEISRIVREPRTVTLFRSAHFRN